MSSNKDAEKQIEYAKRVIDDVFAPSVEKLVESLNKKLEKENLQIGFEFNWFLSKGDKDES